MICVSESDCSQTAVNSTEAGRGINSGNDDRRDKLQTVIIVAVSAIMSTAALFIVWALSRKYPAVYKVLNRVVPAVCLPNPPGRRPNPEGEGVPARTKPGRWCWGSRSRSQSDAQNKKVKRPRQLVFYDHAPETETWERIDDPHAAQSGSRIHGDPGGPGSVKPASSEQGHREGFGASRGGVLRSQSRAAPIPFWTADGARGIGSAELCTLESASSGSSAAAGVRPLPMTQPASVLRERLDRDGSQLGALFASAHSSALHGNHVGRSSAQNYLQSWQHPSNVSSNPPMQLSLSNVSITGALPGGGGQGIPPTPGGAVRSVIFRTNAGMSAAAPFPRSPRAHADQENRESAPRPLTGALRTSAFAPDSHTPLQNLLAASRLQRR
jgi:hypothetical protein